MNPPNQNPKGEFHTTSWSLVNAASGTDDVAAKHALEILCACYWYPLYAFVRRKGAAHLEAEDVVQEFFVRLIEKGELRHVARSKGRFRSFLLAAAQHHLANWRDRERAEKRGGGTVRLAADLAEADERFAREPARGHSPEQEFERAWALEVLKLAVDRLEAEYAGRGSGHVFRALKGELAGEPTSHAAVAAELGLTEGATKVAAHRLRERFGEMLRAIVAETVQSPAAIEAEIGALLRALSA